MARQKISSIVFKGIIISLIFCFPAIMHAKNIDIGSTGDSVRVLGDNFCIGASCISAWGDVSGVWSKNGTSIYYNTGSVGIGITNPTAALDVYRTEPFRTRGQVVFGGSAYIGSGTRLLTVDNAGNVIASSISSTVGLPATATTGQTLRYNGTSWVANPALYSNGTNVGIGTTRPFTKLFIKGSDTQLTLSTDTHNSGASTLRFKLSTDPTDNQNKVAIMATALGSHGRANLHFVLNDNLDSSNTTIADSKLTILSGGNVGIGTIAPSRKLHVNGSAQLDAISFGVTPGTTQTLALSTVEYVNSMVSGVGTSTVGYWTANGTNIYNANSGNVGIGTTAAQSKLMVVDRTANLQARFGDVNTPGLSPAIRFSGELADGTNRHADIQLDTVNDVLSFFAPSAGAPTNRAFNINTSGNVGIGTTNPGTYKLNVAGTTYLNGAATINGIATVNSGLELATGGTRSLSYYGPLANGYFTRMETTGTAGFGTYGPVTSDWALYNRFSGANTRGWIWQLATANVAALSGQGNFQIAGNFNSQGTGSNYFAGNVGIGTTAPSQKLHVNGSAQLDAISFGVTPGSSQTLALSTVEYVNSMVSGVGTSTVGYWTANGADISNVNSGNVGIGTTNPQYKLDLNTGDAADASSINLGTYTTSGEGGGVLWKSNYSGYTKISAAIKQVAEGDFFRSSLAFYTGNNRDKTTNAVEVMRINYLGNVGIGTIAPSRKLHVNGSAQLDAISFGVTPGTTQTLALTTVEYVNDMISGDAQPTVGYWTASGNNIYNANSGNVGVGNTAPGTKLDVGNFTDTSNNVIRVKTSNAYNTGFEAYGSSQGTGYLFVGQSASHGGGIFYNGDLTPAFATGEASDRISFYRMTSGTKEVVFDYVHNSNDVNFRGGVNVAQIANLNSVSFGVTPGSGQGLALSTVEYVNSMVSGVGTSTVGYWTVNGNHIYSANSGNVGIGITAPNHKLELAAATTAAGGIGFGADTELYRSAANILTLASGDSLNLASGNLQVAGTNVVTSGRLIVGNNGTAAAPTFSFSADSNNGMYRGGTDILKFSTASVDRMTILANGNIGIGTAAPSQKLHVNGSAQLDSISFGVTPGESQTLALATVEYVNTKAGGAGGIETGIDGQTLRHNGTSWVANSLFYNSGTNIGIGTTNPGSLLTVANNQWLSARNGADTGIVNMFKVNTNNQIEVGAPLLIGPLEFAANSGLVSFLDMPVTSAAALGLPQGYVMKIDGNNILTVYGESNGSGGIQNARVGIGTASPSAGLDVQGDAFFGTVNKLKVQDLGGTYVAMQATLASSDATKKIIALNPWGGNVGIGTTVTSQKLHVNGGAQLDAISFGVTPGTTQDLALATVEYVNNTISGSGSFVPITGGTLQGPINMGNFDITNVNKLTAGTVDPLYRIKGINYSTFAPSVVGGVKEEYVGKIKIANRNNQGEYEAIIDFSKVEEGSDLWVWRQVVDFSQENVDVLITPYNSFANTYYKIENEKIVIRSSEPVSISYRLIGRRHDWQEWPTRAKDQTEKPSFIID